jgi:hypothetical protein
MTLSAPVTGTLGSGAPCRPRRSVPFLRRQHRLDANEGRTRSGGRHHVRHLNQGGLLVIEPWDFPEDANDRPWVTTVEVDDRALALMETTTLEGRSGPGDPLRHLVSWPRHRPPDGDQDALGLHEGRPRGGVRAGRVVSRARSRRSTGV